MSKLNPIDDGKRPYRPGPLMLLCVIALAVAGGFLLSKIQGKQDVPPPVAEPTTAIVAEIREPLPPPPPPPPSTHPLKGLRRLFLADGSLYRFYELGFTRGLSEQHSFPVAVLEKDVPGLWKFEPVEGSPHVYRILCADENYPEEVGKNLTYTRVMSDPYVGDPKPLDDKPPYLILRHEYPSQWEVRKMPHKDQYELYCRQGSKPFLGQSLGWIAEQEDLKYPAVTATLGHNGNPSWWILPPDQKPATPRRVTHLIIMPRGEVEEMAKAEQHYQEKGASVFEVDLETDEDEFTRTGGGTDLVKLIKSLQGKDPVLQHDDFPPLLTFDPLNPTKLPTSDTLFPLVIPLKIALSAGDIRELVFKDTEFYLNTWEKLEDFQSHLDESDASDGRVYKGEKFLYIFVASDE